MPKQLPVLTPSPLPPLYAGWIDELLAGPIPRETDATCDDCAMLSKDNGGLVNSADFFNPQTKCCSYIPSIPNFLAGRILEDEDPGQAAGRATIEDRIGAGVAITPLGLEQPRNFQVLYGHSSESLFGQSRSLRCPHYLDAEGGRCGIWKHRASVCATWHCKFVRGAVGSDFWTLLQGLLSAVEKTLARWCVLELDIGSEALSQLFVATRGLQSGGKIHASVLDGLADPAASRKIWGKWSGREVEFYRESARMVNALNWQDVTALNRAEIQMCARLLREAYSRLMSDEIPERLQVGAFQVVRMDQDSCSINSYSKYDPLSLPKQLMDVLRYFDGRPTSEALNAIVETESLRLDATLVRKLADFGVLVPVRD